MKYLRYSMKHVVLCVLLIVSALPSLALSGAEHQADMQRIFPFAWNDGNDKNKLVMDFYKRVNVYLDHPYVEPGQHPSKKDPKRPKFVVDNPKLSLIHWDGGHRIWFHWGFNTDPRQFEPLTSGLERARSAGIINQRDIDAFWASLTEEIAKQNRALMNESAQIFGFGDLGAISASERRQINAIVTMLYSIHVVGDYETTDTMGLSPLSRVYADIYNAIDNLAGRNPENYKKAKDLKTRLRASQMDPKSFLDALELYFSPFLLSLKGDSYDYGARFKKLGYRLK